MLVLSGRPVRLYSDQPTPRNGLAEVLAESLVDQVIGHELSSPLDYFFGGFFTVFGSSNLGVAVRLASVLGGPTASVGVACEIYCFVHDYILALGSDTPC